MSCGISVAPQIVHLCNDQFIFVMTKVTDKLVSLQLSDDKEGYTLQVAVLSLGFSTADMAHNVTLIQLLQTIAIITR